MKKFLSSSTVLFVALFGNAQSVGIGTTAPDTSAILHLSSTTKGFLVPRMDSVQRNLIASPAQGLLIYQSKANGGFYYYAGTTWNKVGGGGNEWIKNANGDIYTGKNVGFGNANPTEKLDISGHIKTTGEIKPNGTAGLANQVLTATGTGSMVWANAATGEETSGSGTWGDCSVNNITDYQPKSDADGVSSDRFGHAVAISGSYAIVGAYTNDEGAGLTDNGSAHIYKRNSTTGMWEAQEKLLNINTATADHFGYSVALSGDYAIVGAPYDNEGAGLTNNGSASIFKRNNVSGIWEPQGKLVNPGAANTDLFGWSVSISGDYAIVGAYGDDNAAGSATVFKRNSISGIWESQGKLLNAAPVATDYFGRSVGISGDYAIVGANDDDAGGTATIFKRNTGTGIWEALPQGKLADGDLGGSFGVSVSISGDYAIVGASYDNEGPGLSADGSATIFKRNTTTNVWEQQLKLHNTAPGTSDYFGSSVFISGEYVIISATGDDEGAGLDNTGSVSIFKRNGAIWRLVQKFTAANAGSNEFFGTAVGIEGTTGRFLVGASFIQSSTGEAFFGKVK
ncbi:MAG: FG-GAP repeat protein [Bacteroidota bacterium]